MPKKLNREGFIARAKKKHGNSRYNYDLVKYTKSNQKVEIVCNEHGSFWQRPDNHLQGQGCPECKKLSVSRKLSLDFDSFLERSRNTHGNKYSYPQKSIRNTRERIPIKCPEHGIFFQSPEKHMYGQGCPKCGIEKIKRSKRYTKDSFTSKARKIHVDNKYNYDLVKYTKANQKVEIVCPEHGSFWQTPRSHLQGSGCPKCGIENNRQKRVLSREEFIARAREIHGDKYSYDLVQYKNMLEKIEIVCPKHGSFWQTPGNHISNMNGCPRCKHPLRQQQEIYDLVVELMREREMNAKKT